ncbi:DUF1947 domain-containing protein [Candidatus Woesearchaeota archaeon]|nr:DUF1947 domain-containing protein [Candidatus Woesearchaeota archaeon]
MKRVPLKSKEINKELEVHGISVDKKDFVELQEEEKQKIIFINRQPSFFYYEEKLIPTLKYLQQNQNFLKQITIDKGAIKFIVNGADVMRPGITDIQKLIQKNDVVVIIDQEHKKPLAVGIALFNSEEMKAATKGKMVKNIHYVGDEVWKVS